MPCMHVCQQQNLATYGHPSAPWSMANRGPWTVESKMVLIES